VQGEGCGVRLLYVFVHTRHSDYTGCNAGRLSMMPTSAAGRSAGARPATRAAVVGVRSDRNGHRGLHAEAVRRHAIALAVTAAALFYVHYRGERRLDGHELPVDDFDLFAMAPRVCVETFRFMHEHILLLVDLLGFPAVFVTGNRLRLPSVTAFCILLWRMRYPSRLCDGVPLFRRTVDELSRVHNEVASFLMARFAHRMQRWDHARLTPAVLRRFADAIAGRGAALQNCIGFIDGTVRAICRPRREQRANYNGHHRVHALKYQSVVTPDGLIAHLSGPFVGRRHDARMLAESGLLEELQAHANGPHGAYYLYGDPAYGISMHLQSPFRKPFANDVQARFNASMSSVRECVEWQFGKVVGLWAFCDFKKNQKLLLQQVGSFYFCAVLLTNCHTCLYGSQTSFYFDIDAPTVEAYIGSMRLDVPAQA